MPAAVEIKESFSVQSPSVIYGMTVVAEQVETLVSLIDSEAPRLPELYAGLAAQYRRLPPVEDTSGGLPGDRYPF